MVKKVSDLDVSNTPLLIVPENSKESYFINPKFLRTIEGVSPDLYKNGSLSGWNPGGGGGGGGGNNLAPSLDDIVGTPVQEKYYEQGKLKVKVTFTLKNSSAEPIIGFDARVATSLTAPTSLTSPFLSPGTGTLGSTAFSVTNGTWANFPTSYSYQWRYLTSGGWTSYGGATSATWTPPSSLSTTFGFLYTIACNVTATNAAGSTTAISNSVSVN